MLVVNRAPVTNAGAIEALLTSPNGSNAVAVLDGSMPFDPALAAQLIADARAIIDALNGP